jgi:hypothetical protein
MLQFEVISAKEETKIVPALRRMSRKTLFVKIFSKLRARGGNGCGRGVICLF